MKFSVVINTFNRANSLRNTLRSLEQQTFRDFEVLVVNGPSTDHTSAVLDEFRGRIRAIDCPKPRLAVSRNLGIEAAGGDIVAFIDDDSLAANDWLEQLASAYLEPNVGAVGGLVYDPTGVQLQYRFAACHRNGVPVYKVEPPLDPYLQPGADPVAYLQGTNMSYSRKALRDIGGFDEKIRHFYDDVDVCVRIVDRGYQLRQLETAVVHHKFLASHVRDHKRMTLDPYNQLFDRIYFGLKHGRGRYALTDLIKGFVEEAHQLRAAADDHAARGEMTPEQREHIHRRVDEALQDGLNAQPAHALQALRKIESSEAGPFQPYPTRQPSGRRLRLCLISREYPPGDFGGPGRYTHELAAGFAAAGHDVHVITRSPDIYRLDQEEGVWVHRLPAVDRLVPELEGVAAKAHLAGMAAAYHEICKIHDEKPVDIALSPLWLCEGMACLFDDRFATAVTVITAMKAVATLAEWARKSPEAQQLVKLEEAYMRSARSLHAISGAIRDRAVADYSVDARRAFVSPLGLKDRSLEYPRQRAEDGRLRILYVGRLETRKGAGEFLAMAERLAPEFPEIEFVLAGKEIPDESGTSHRERFQQRHAGNPQLNARVTFTGMVTDEQLYQHYADCDIFCLPTHYESFGLVFVEAMMWGKPLVGSRVGGVPEVVAEGEQGFLCPVQDIDAVTAAVRKLIVDPDLRARFGRRSRELYEDKWEIGRVVETMAKDFEGIARLQRSESRRSPAAAAPLAEVQAGFAEVLAGAVGLAPDAALAASQRLLNPRHFPVDLTREIQNCWYGTRAAFVEGIFQVLLGRPLGRGEEKPWLDAINLGVSKVDIVSMLLESDEFRRRHGNCTVAELLTPEQLAIPGFGVSRASAELAPTAPVAVAESGFKTKLAKSRYLGKFLKYTKRAIYLPWNFQKFYESHPATLRSVQDGVRQYQSRTEELVREIANGQAEHAAKLAAFQGKLASLDRVANTILAHQKLNQDLREWILDLGERQTHSVESAVGNLSAEVAQGRQLVQGTIEAIQADVQQLRARIDQSQAGIEKKLREIGEQGDKDRIYFDWQMKTTETAQKQAIRLCDAIQDIVGTLATEPYSETEPRILSIGDQNKEAA